ncbi:putative polyketide cyclase [Actinomadura rubteroloni]|uniref:Putative polyketide cyclase n=1 Tax=Actinomadura rubteroloni TaxID=1926885 RepID=A0A2P4UCQ6_9ACTN|nr:aromatase/cyclase [Actinomadura rubteroloni]POM22834.1 putative polyketide cyclase [Actinomadura rubteroloni]
MIHHTLIYRFADSVSEKDRQQFLHELGELVLGSGLVEGFDVQPHQWLPVDDRSPGLTGTVIATYACRDLETMQRFSEQPRTHEFIAGWRSRISYEAAYANHAPLVPVAPEVSAMKHTEHTVTVNAPLDVVWEVLVDVEGYAEIFPPTQEVTMLEQSPEHQIARLVVDVNGEIQSWVSRRDIDVQHRIISYRQLENAPLMAHMGGDWRALPIKDDVTQLVLTHDFKAKDPVDGKVAGKYTPEEAEAMLDAAVERNSVADLGAVKEVAEKKAAERS